MPSSEVMSKWKEGELHSGSKKGPVVKNQKQAVAIMLSERKAEMAHGGKYPEKTGYNKGGDVKPSSAAAHTQNLVETAANPTGRKGFKKGGLIEKANNPPTGGHWKRWGAR